VIHPTSQKPIEPAMSPAPQGFSVARKTAVSSKPQPMPTPLLPNPTTMQAVKSVPTAGVALAVPGQTPVAAGADALNAAALGTTVNSILTIIDVLLANEGQIKELLAVTEKSGNFVYNVGNAIMDIGGKAAELTKKLWSGSVLEKIGAVFTGVGTGLLYGVGGALTGAGWVAKTVSGEFFKAFGREPTTPPDYEIEALKEENAKLDAQLEQKLDELKRASPQTHKAVLDEIARRRAQASA
jgi:hypothetical protein